MFWFVNRSITGPLSWSIGHPRGHCALSAPALSLYFKVSMFGVRSANVGATHLPLGGH